MPLLFSLKIDNGIEREFTLDEGKQITIGRISCTDLTLSSDLGISKQHCKIFQKNGICYIEDLKSRNGTYVNNEAIDVSTPLKNGDEIIIGNTRITFLLNKPFLHSSTSGASMTRIVPIEEFKRCWSQTSTSITDSPETLMLEIKRLGILKKYPPHCLTTLT